MMNAASLIFSNIHDSTIPEFTAVRTMASVPFAGRYRLIDFALSNVVNSGITRVGIITHYNYQSLVEHIGNGKDWDLARRTGGIKVLPPFITAFDNSVAAKVYETRLEALLGVMNFITNCTEEYVVLMDSDVVLNIDFRKVIKAHEKTGADITIVTKKLRPDSGSIGKQSYCVRTNADGRLTDLTEVTDTDLESDELSVSTNIFVFKRRYLLDLLLDARVRGYKNFYRHIVSANIEKANIRAYEYDGYYAKISSLAGYYRENLNLLCPESRRALFEIDGRSIYTKIRNTAPTSYHPGSKIKNSLIADGCVIEGVVENSVIFRGVKVGRGTVVRNSVILQDTYIGNNASLDCVVTDKAAVIHDNRSLKGDESLPFFVPKGTMI